jgi:hypothetical protein
VFEVTISYQGEISHLIVTVLLHSLGQILQFCQTPIKWSPSDSGVKALITSVIDFKERGPIFDEVEISLK